MEEIIDTEPYKSAIKILAEKHNMTPKEFVQKCINEAQQQSIPTHWMAILRRYMIKNNINFRRIKIYVSEIENENKEREIACLISTWNITHPENIAINLALVFNYLKCELEKEFNCFIPHIVIKNGKSIILDDKAFHKIWKQQNLKGE